MEPLTKICCLVRGVRGLLAISDLLKGTENPSLQRLEMQKTVMNFVTVIKTNNDTRLHGGSFLVLHQHQSYLNMWLFP